MLDGLDVLERLEWWVLLRTVPGVECPRLSTLTMIVNKPGVMGGVREAILCLVAPLRRCAGEPKMGVRLKKTDSWIAGAAFSNQLLPSTGTLIGEVAQGRALDPPMH